MEKASKRLFRLLNHSEELLCSIAMSIVILAVMANILLGITTGRRYGQLEELAITAFVWVTFLGASVAYKRGAHICIDFLVKKFPERMQMLTDLLIKLFLIAFNSYLVYMAWVLSINARITSPMLNIPYFYIYLSVVLGFGCMTIRIIIDLVRDITRLRKGESTL